VSAWICLLTVAPKGIVFESWARSFMPILSNSGAIIPALASVSGRRLYSAYKGGYAMTGNGDSLPFRCAARWVRFTL
jgi:hypothetical protein